MYPDFKEMYLETCEIQCFHSHSNFSRSTSNFDSTPHPGTHCLISKCSQDSYRHLRISELGESTSLSGASYTQSEVGDKHGFIWGKASGWLQNRKIEGWLQGQPKRKSPEPSMWFLFCFLKATYTHALFGIQYENKS